MFYSLFYCTYVHIFLQEKVVTMLPKQKCGKSFWNKAKDGCLAM